ncbi:MAG: SCP2 sterol-binding domain-containing protein [Proteobacteria bacterium]|nr:SCP2 sterol-binding domain-containing protein [Pseudomonadota bacterium]
MLSRLGALLEGALHGALALDPQIAATLAPLEGRRVGVELRGVNLALAIAVRDGKLRVGPHWQATPDLNVRAAPASLLAFALRRGDDMPVPPGKVEISGDAQLARVLEKLARDFRPDIEEAFAKSFGDVIGVALAMAIRQAFAHVRAGAKSLVQDTAEFLREESRDLVAPAEMEQFLDDVDALRERADRLDARVKRIATIRGAA